MKITSEAKKVLEGLFEENHADGLIVMLEETCCGKSPVFQLAVFDENDTPETIDGISVLMPEDAKAAVEELTIDVKDGQLVVMGPESGCGCGGCGGGCHE